MNNWQRASLAKTCETRWRELHVGLLLHLDLDGMFHGDNRSSDGFG